MTATIDPFGLAYSLADVDQANAPPLAAWQQVFREGFAPTFTTAGLYSLLEALRRDDPRLLQGATTMPPPLQCVQDWPVEGADAVTWTAWQAGANPDCQTVGEAESYFARCCFEADKNLGEPAACRWFLNWFDDTPRQEMFAEIAEEIEKELTNREEMAEPCGQMYTDGPLPADVPF